MLKKKEISTLASRFSILKMFSSFFYRIASLSCADIIHRMLLESIHKVLVHSHYSVTASIIYGHHPMQIIGKKMTDLRGCLLFNLTLS